MKIRLRFSKGGALRYIGHLDFLRVFGQTIRRAGLPMAFSQGFNPHLLISFALPLSLGVQSENDYADITLAEECPAILQKLNAAAPAGLTIKAAYPATDKAASVVAIADYKIKTLGALSPSPLNPYNWEGKIGEILERKEICVAKKTKKGVRDVDIRADILGLEMRDDGLFMRLSAGSARFLNPLTVLETLCPGAGDKTMAAHITRTELYREDGTIL